MNNFFQKMIHFFREAIAELRKVTWLSRNEAIASTIVILILICILSVYVGFIDFILSKIFAVIL